MSTTNQPRSAQWYEGEGQSGLNGNPQVHLTNQQGLLGHMASWLGGAQWSRLVKGRDHVGNALK